MKTKVLFILKKIIFITIVVFLFQNCVTTTFTKKLRHKYSSSKEFLTCQKVDSNNILKKIDSDVNLFKGVYLGKIKNKSSFLYRFEFNGMLDGENRIIDMYLNKDLDKLSVIKEKKKLLKGNPAFLFYGCSNSFGYNNKYTNKIFYPKSDNKNYFIDSIKNSINLSDTVFILGFNYSNDKHNDLSKIYVNMYIKDNNNNYNLVKRNQITPTKIQKKVKLKFKNRNKTAYLLKHSIYVATALVDAITSPFQLIGILLFKKGGGLSTLG